MNTATDLENPFWKFSLAAYGTQGVADECLALQERLALDVNLLLFAAYAGAAEGIELGAADIAAAAAAVGAWHDDVVRTLRRARRALKPYETDTGNPLGKPSAALRTRVKGAELEAEKIEQAMLWNWSRRHLAGRNGSDRQAALLANLRALMAHYGVSAGQDDPSRAMPHLLDAAMVHSAGP